MEENKEVIKDLIKETYNDVGKPVAKPLGKTLGLIPRAIKAALLPLEKWILQREYNLAETEKLLEEKLKNISPEQITTPEAYVAVPALQYLSYCMDNNELRDMYANLLANSMNNVVKNGVHPGFVEIIKQLCPDEAKVLKYVFAEKSVPIISLRASNSSNSEIDVVKNFSNIGELACCEKPLFIGAYFNNLIRLGLLAQDVGRHFTNDKFYKPLEEHPNIVSAKNNIEEDKVWGEFNKAVVNKGIIRLTDYGNQFCEICLSK